MQAVTTITQQPVRPNAPALPGVLRRLMRNHPAFQVHDQRSAARPELQAFIRRTFADAYDADVSVFAPLLLELRCAGQISGVAGIRPATGQKLFVEHYLDEPAEICISEHAGRTVHRSEVVEVCNLAAHRPGACQLITVMLTASLREAGFRYAVLAGTAQLEKILRKQNFRVQKIVAADPARLGAEAQQWGRYYATCPHVMLVDLDATLESLSQQLLASAILNFLADDAVSLSHVLAANRAPSYCA